MALHFWLIPFVAVFPTVSKGFVANTNVRFFRKLLIPTFACCSPTEADLQLARAPLNWERSESLEASPLLNLSRRDGDLCISEDDSNQVVILSPTGTSWEDGHVWSATWQLLYESGIVSNNDDAEASRRILRAAPQLLRLNTSSIEESLSCIYQEFAESGMKIIASEPMILTYRPDHIRYGLQFLAKMMGGVSTAVVITASALKPKLLMAGIESGIQEGLVARTFASASSAMTQVNGILVKDSVDALRKSAQGPA
jgi:hypothetical protein